MVLLLAGCFPAPDVLRAPDPPLVTGASVDRFELVGEDRIDLLESCLHRCPHDDLGQVVPSRTTWWASWSWSPGAGGPCLLGGATVDVAVDVELPDWRPVPDLADAWDGYVGALARHEQGHVDLAHAWARSINGGPPRCSAEGDDDVALAELRRLQVAYDDETDHGHTQGARFFD